MPVPRTTRIGPYEIIDLAGKGGMGEVYRALDTRLDRIVAIKLIAEELSNSSIGRGRFLSEARAASAVNHANICTVYDIGEWEGRPFLAMEYLEGKNLKSYLQGCPLQTEALLNLGAQIADALCAAHGRGILHRDIKPSNIFITTEGIIKVVDFGLAKRGFQNPQVQMVAGSPTLVTLTASDDLFTSPGSVAGTAPYMSPEQARGEDLDSRSDLFSFGLVLYEMATGSLAFQGGTVAELFAQLLTSEPVPPSTISPRVPEPFDGIVAKALEKDRNLRYQHASEIRADLKRLQRSLKLDPNRPATPFQDVSVKGVKAAAVIDRNTRGKAIWLTGAAVVLTALVAIFFARIEQPAPVHLKQVQITTNASGRPAYYPCISPSGKYLAYSDAQNISIRLIATGEIRTLKRPDVLFGEYNWMPVYWFPDETRLLVNAESWIHQDGVFHSSIWSVSVLTGSATKLRDDAVASAVALKSFLIAFRSGGDRFDQEIWVMGPEGQDARRIIALPSGRKARFGGARWLPNESGLGYLKGYQEGSNHKLMLESVDLIEGQSRVLVQDASRWKAFHWLPNNKLLYVDTEAGAEGQNLWEVSTDSLNFAPLGKPNRVADLPSWASDGLYVSADGKKVAFSKGTSRWSVFISHLLANGMIDTPIEITSKDPEDMLMDWTADGKAVIFGRTNSSKEFSLYKQAVDSDTADPLAVLKVGERMIARTMPGGTSLLVTYNPQDAMKIDALGRISMTGGLPEIISRGHFLQVDCARTPATVCVIEKLVTPKGPTTMIAYDVRNNALRELFTLSNSESWNLAPDGSHLVTWLHNGPVRIRSLDGSIQKEFTLEGFNYLLDVEWGTGGNFLVGSAQNSAGYSLLRLDFKGRVQTISLFKGVMWPYPSPDGKQLALSESSDESNIWMLEGL